MLSYLISDPNLTFGGWKESVALNHCEHVEGRKEGRKLQEDLKMLSWSSISEAWVVLVRVHTLERCWCPFDKISRPTTCHPFNKAYVFSQICWRQMRIFVNTWNLGREEGKYQQYVVCHPFNKAWVFTNMFKTNADICETHETLKFQ